MASRRQAAQLSLAARDTGHRGGYRAKAGRPRKAVEDRKGHFPRPALASRFPVHVTLKLLPSATPSLRRGDCFQVVRRCFVLGNEKEFGFRLVHFSVQGHHIHLICEGKDQVALTRGMQGLAIRVARRLNARLNHKGKVFAERYHERILRSPTETRRAILYVLNNSRRHSPDRYDRGWLDPCSSAPWFDGWTYRPTEPWFRPEGEVPVARPATWLLRSGWRLRGLLSPDEIPGGDP